MILAGRYELVRRIGRGGMGQVWEGRDLVLGRRVAVKVVHLDTAGDTTAATRFRREAVATAALSHPSIVTVHDAGTDDGTAYLVMEFVDGEDLARRLRRSGPLPVPEAVRIGEQVAEALAAAHAVGVVHRDIKPANVLVEGPHVTVVDFGVAALTRSGGAPLTAPGTTVGTAEYMAPEQATAEAITPAVDVYSLGCLLTALLTGRPPFADGHTVAILRAQVEDTPPTPSASRPEVPAALDRLLADMLAKNPLDRPDAATVATTLATFREPTTTAPTRVTAASVPPVIPPTRALPDAGGPPSASPGADAGRRRRWGVALAVVVILLAMGLAFTVLGGPASPHAESIATPTTDPTAPVDATTAPSPSPATPTPEISSTVPTADEVLADVTRAVAALTVGGRNPEKARKDLTSRVDDLAEAAADGDVAKAERRVRDLDRRIEALTRDGTLDPAETATVHDQLDRLASTLAGEA